MTLTDMKLTVIGAGIGGLAVAMALAQRGASVRVLEQADAIREEGAGLQISPNGARVLQALGLGDVLRAAGMQAQAVRLLDYRPLTGAYIQTGTDCLGHNQLLPAGRGLAPSARAG